VAARRLNLAALCGSGAATLSDGGAAAWVAERRWGWTGRVGDGGLYRERGKG
jgi:hypothetical protein